MKKRDDVPLLAFEFKTIQKPDKSVFQMITATQKNPLW